MVPALMLVSILLSTILNSVASVPLAHPLSDRTFDCAVQISVARRRIAVDYVLALNDLTLTTELLGLVEPGQAAVSPSAARRQYAQVVQPILARGLQIEVDGQPLELQPAGHRINLLDHVEYHFRFEAGFTGSDESVAITVADGNFPGERGFRRIAIDCLAGRVAQSDVPVSLASIPLLPNWEMSPEAEERTRRAKATLHFAGLERFASDPAPTMAESNRAERWDLRELLTESRFGFGAVLGLAFVFGMLHAIKPGHGKTMVAAYLVGSQGTVVHAVMLGAVTAITHTAAVLFVAFMLRPVAGAPWVDQGTLSFWLTLTSGAAIVWLGSLLFWRRACGREDLLHVHGPGGHTHLPDGSIRWEGDVSTANLVTLGLSGGLIPCDDAVLLLLAAIGAGMLAQAIFILLAFSAGLATVLVAIGIMVVKLRGFAVGHSGVPRLAKALQIASSLAIVAVGLGLCVAAFRT